MGPRGLAKETSNLRNSEDSKELKDSKGLKGLKGLKKSKDLKSLRKLKGLRNLKGRSWRQNLRDFEDLILWGKMRDSNSLSKSKYLKNLGDSLVLKSLSILKYFEHFVVKAQDHYFREI